MSVSFRGGWAPRRAVVRGRRTGRMDFMVVDGADFCLVLLLD